MFDQLILTLGQEDAPPSLPPTDQDLAPTTEQTQPIGESDHQGPPPGIPPVMMIIFGALVVMIIFSMNGQRREKKKRAKMLTELKKGARVQTIGGILGTTVEVRDDHVVVKIDENTNTRVKFGRSAIQAVLSDKDE